MAPHHRAMIFCLTLFLLAPGLFAAGEWLGGVPLGAGLAGVAVLASFALLWTGEST